MKKTFFLGFKKTLPLQTGVVPFGVLYGSLAISLGFPWWIVMSLSVLVFGGSSQLVFIDTYQRLLSGFQAALGANIINARHLIYSAGMSREFAEFTPRWRYLLSYLLTDQLYAISQSRAESFKHLPTEIRPWFYLGSGFCTWIFWQISCAAGIIFGHFIPASLNLGFSIPLMMMPMLFDITKNLAGYLTALLGFIFFYFFKGLPYGFDVILSIILASVCGYAASRMMSTRRGVR